MNSEQHPPKEVEGNDSDKQFQLSPALVVIGLLAIALGIGCGLIMSSATFLR